MLALNHANHDYIPVYPNPQDEPKGCCSPLPVCPSPPREANPGSRIKDKKENEEFRQPNQAISSRAPPSTQRCVSIGVMLRQLCVVLTLAVASGFNVAPAARPASSLRRSAARAPQPQAVVIEISSQEEFDKALDGAGASLVVIDYSTSWCGPCKIIAPKYDEFSEQYKNVAFLKVRRPRRPPAGLSGPLASATTRHVHEAGRQPLHRTSHPSNDPLLLRLLDPWPQVMGDSSPEADKLMRGQGVRALPSFHFWKDKKQVDSISGAKTQALQDAIEQHM